MLRVNVGCGQTPTSGWKNYDNSIGVKLARHRVVTFLLAMSKLLNLEQMQFVEFCRKTDISWANACKWIPVPDESVEVLYTSHMLEHLDRDDLAGFLREAWRVLAPAGIIRIAVPDIRLHAERYIACGDADSFVAATHMTRTRPRTWREKLTYLYVGDRNHLWMYDGPSMSKLLQSFGFVDAQILPAGSTLISDPYPLNLREREEESVYLEARKSKSRSVSCGPVG